MARNPRYDLLFEPVRIGPVTARNRFYAVPHAAGMTNSMPHMRAAFRETKAEGGWGVVCTGYVSIDPGSDDTPLPYATLWDDDDVRSHALVTEGVGADVVVVPQRCVGQGRIVRTRVDRHIAGTHDAPAALGLGLAESGTHVRHGVGHARGVRHCVEAVARSDGSDPHGLEQQVISR